MKVRDLHSSLQELNVDAFLVSNPSNIFYLTSLSQFLHPGDAFFLTNGKKSYLFTNSLYADGVVSSNKFELCVISADTTLVDHINKIVRHEKWRSVGFESQDMSVAFYSHLKKGFQMRMVPTQNIVEELRSCKTEREISSIKKACLLTDKAYNHVLKSVRRGISERQIAFEIEKFIRLKGGELAFPVIAACGAHAATPHHSNSDRKLSSKHKLILLDFGAKVDGYCSDMTRCIFIDTPTDNFTSTYESLLMVQRETIEFAKKSSKNSSLAEVAKYCNSLIEKESLPALPHSLGHGLGIGIHESPRVSPTSEDTLSAGTVFTIEPGVYVPGRFGMRIEDTVAYEKDGLSILTKSQKDKVVISL